MFTFDGVTGALWILGEDHPDVGLGLVPVGELNDIRSRAGVAPVEARDEARVWGVGTAISWWGRLRLPLE